MTQVWTARPRAAAAHPGDVILLTRRLLVLLAVAVVIAGCARRAEPPEPVPDPLMIEAPMPGGDTGAPDEEPSEVPSGPAALQDPSPEPSTQGPSATPAPEGARSGQAEPEEPVEEAIWRIPAGPLDDAKFAAISAKVTVAAVRLHAEGASDQDAMMNVMRSVLKEARVTLDEYTRYADGVHRDPVRAGKVGNAILRLAEKHGDLRLTDEAYDILGDLKPMGVVDAE